MTTTTMPTLTAARLVAGHVDRLWRQWSDGGGCCVVCCAPCAALWSLLGPGLLDELYGVYMDRVGGGSETWDAENRQVGREWLVQAWGVDLGCRLDHEEAA